MPSASTFVLFMGRSCGKVRASCLVSGASFSFIIPLGSVTVSKLFPLLSVFGLFMLFSSNSWAEQCRVVGVSVGETRVELHCNNGKGNMAALTTRTYSVNRAKFAYLAKQVVEMGTAAKKDRSKHGGRVYIETAGKSPTVPCSAGKCKRLTLISTYLGYRGPAKKPSARGGSSRVKFGPRKKK